MIFNNLIVDSVVQVDDMLMLDVSKSFVTADETVTDVEIQPSAADLFISVFNIDKRKWQLLWAYETAGDVVISVRITTDLGTKTNAYSLKVLTEVEDTLFSKDSDLIPFEHDIMEYLPKGRNSYKYAHRASQEIIIAYLDEKRVWKCDGSKYTKEEIAAITDDEIRDQFRQWSTYQTLLIVLENSQVSTDDIFQEKKSEYMLLRNGARNRGALRLDQDNDGEIDDNHEKKDMVSTRMVRR